MNQSSRTRPGTFRRAVAFALATLLISVLSPVSSASAATSRVDLRVLVVSNGEPSADAIATQLDREGVPYTKISVGAAGRQVIDAQFLADATVGRAKFQGIVLPNQAGGGLAAAEVAALVAYERTYGVRRVNAYDFPGANMGFAGSTYAGGLDGSTATVTPAGRAGPFSYLDGPVPIDDFEPGIVENVSLEVYGYLAQGASPLPAGETFTPLLTGAMNGQTGVLAGVYSHDGREELTLTAAYNPFMQWYNVIAPGIVNWLTRGVHLGFQRNYFAVHVDDVFLPDSRWSVTANCTPGDNCVNPSVTTPDIRMTAAEVDTLVAWQDSHDFEMDMVFNGGGSDLWKAEHNNLDPLTDTFLARQAEFPWINHTFTHPFLGCIQIAPLVQGQNWHCATSATEQPRQDEDLEGQESGGIWWASQRLVTDQIENNITWATGKLTDFDRTELVTGEHSGLRMLSTEPQPNDNPFLAPSLDQVGVEYIASDASREPDARRVGSAPGAAITVPRHPMNIFYNTATFQELIDEYNWIYNTRAAGGSGICEDNPQTSTCIDPLPAGSAGDARSSFDDYLLPLEVRNALRYVLVNDPAPFYAHQSNLAEEGVLYPVVEGVLAAYRSLHADNAPIVRTDMAGQSAALSRLTSWRAGNDSVTGWIDASGIHVPDAAGQVPITVPTGTTSVSGVSLQSYAGDLSGWASGAATAVPPTPMGGYVGSQTPSAPTIGLATPGDASATVSWTAPTTPGTGSITGYEVRAIPAQVTTDTPVVTATVLVPTATSGAVTGLRNGTTYTLEVAALSTVGTGAFSAPSNEVTPQAPAVPPTVVERTPAIDATGVLPETDVVVKFSEPVTGVSQTSFTLTGPDGAVAAAFTYDAETLLATLKPGELKGNARYTVNLTADIKDVARGVPLVPVSWSFTTGAATAPKVTGTTPADGATGVLPTDNVSVTFSEPVTGVLNSGAFTLRANGGAAVAAAVSYDEVNGIAVLDPDQELLANTVYIAGLTADVRDKIGNPLAATTWRFTTGTGAVPTVVVEPTNGATAIPTTASVSVKFSETVTGAGGPNAFTLTGPSGPVQATVTYDAAALTAVLNPVPALAPDTRYTATLAESIRDAAGNAVDEAQRSWSFTTEPAPAPAAPTVTPADGTYPVVQTVRASNTEAGVVHRYTVSTTGTAPDDPVVTSEELPAGGLSVGQSSIVRVRSFDAAGNGSTTVTRTYAINLADTVAPPAPEVTPADGTYPVVQTVRASNTEAGVVHRYTVSTTGTAPDDPVVTSEELPAGGLSVGQSSIVRVRSFDAAGNGSTTVTRTYAINLADTVAPPAPEVTPADGTYPVVQTVRASNTEAGVVHRYTVSTTGTAPDDPVVTSEELPAGGLSVGQSSIVRVRSFDAAGNGSTTVTRTYAINLADTVAPPAPEVTPADGTYPVVQTVRASNTEAGVVHRYTVSTTGTAPDDPVVTSEELPAGGLSVGQSSIVRVRSFDAAGNGSTTVTRTYAITPATSAPTATVAPANGATGVAVTSNVTATFSVPVQAATVTTTSFTLRRGTATGALVTAPVSYDEATQVATLDPGANLAQNAQYTAQLTAEIRSAVGNVQLVATSWSFTTARPGFPTVTVTPVNGATDVAVGSNVQATFSEAVSGVPGSFTLRVGTNGALVPASVTYDATTRVGTLNPTQDLRAGTLYTALLTNGVQDANGNSLARTTWTFTTSAEGVPTISSTTPTQGLTGVATEANVTVTFIEPVTGVANGSFALRRADGSNVGRAVTYDAASRTATLNPNAELFANEVYTVSLTAGIRDASGNPLAATSWSFTTGTGTAPTVTPGTPAANATGAARSANITATFSEAVRGVNRTNVTLRVAGATTGTPVAATVSYNGNNRRVTINPNANLAANTQYTVTFTGGTTAIRDTRNVPLVTTSWNFTTGG